MQSDIERKFSNLTQTQKAGLNEVLEMLELYTCAGKALYSNLIASGRKLSFTSILLRPRLAHMTQQQEKLSSRVSQILIWTWFRKNCFTLIKTSSTPAEQAIMYYQGGSI